MRGATATQYTYRIKPGARFKESDAEVIGPELVKIAERHEGSFTPEQVVEAAQPTAAPLHRFFDWDDATAAEKWRVHQARVMTGSIEVKIEVRDAPLPVAQWVRQFHNVVVAESQEEPAATRYVPLQIVQSSDDYLQQVIAKAGAELQGWRERYATYRNLSTFQRSFGEVLAILDSLATAAD